VVGTSGSDGLGLGIGSRAVAVVIVVVVVGVASKICKYGMFMGDADGDPVYIFIEEGAAKVGCDVVGSLVASIGRRVGTDVVVAAVGDNDPPKLVGTEVGDEAEDESFPVSVEFDEEPNVGEVDDGVLIVVGDEDRLLSRSVGREPDVGRIDEEGRSDTVGPHVGKKEYNSSPEVSPPEVVVEVGAAEDDNDASPVVFAAEDDGEYVTASSEVETLSDGE